MSDSQLYWSCKKSLEEETRDNHATSENDMDGTEDDLNAPSTSHGTGSTTPFPPSPPDLLGRHSAFDEYFVFGDVGPTPFKNYNAVEKIVINKKIDAAKEDENIKIIEKEVYRLHNEATHAYYNRFFETTISKLKIAEAFLNLAITCDYDQFDRIRKLILRTYICLADAYTESNQISQCILINQRINTEFSVDDVVRYKFVEFQVMTENLADSTTLERHV
ncbi:unnamed protein product [Spodoptera exigua]|nr:unnamed protein product [Spodoptera exigua]